MVGGDTAYVVVRAEKEGDEYRAVPVLVTKDERHAAAIEMAFGTPYTIVPFVDDARPYITRAVDDE